MIEVYEKPVFENNAETDIFFATKNGKAGWMNVIGDWVIPAEYDTTFVGTWRRAAVVLKKNGKYGVINYMNEVIIPFEYNEAPWINENGLITVTANEGRYKQAYFSKKGEQLTEFMNPLFEFFNGFAVITSNRKILGRYTRYRSEKGISQIWATDFVIINSNFDTLLSIQNTPFIVDLGTLNHNLRSFIIYPYLSRHADLGLSYGMFGYLNEKGEIVIEPKFRTLHASREKEFMHTRTFPFNSNRSLVIGDSNKYSFIDPTGKKVFEKNSNDQMITSISHFNDYGLAVMRSKNDKAKYSTIVSLIDTSGHVIYESDESKAYLGIPGNIHSSPGNRFLAITSIKNQELIFYTPTFDKLGTYPLKDADFNYIYHFREIYSLEKDEPLSLIQERGNKSITSPEKRVVSITGKPLTSWVNLKSLLSYKYGVYSVSDSINNKMTFYSFSHKKIFTCSSCLYAAKHKLDIFGVYKVYQKENGVKIINFKGNVLSDLFTSMNENIVSLAQQIEEYNKSEVKTFELDKSVFIDLFNKSEISNGISKY